MSTYLGTDGFRGETGITLTADHAYNVDAFWGDITMLFVSATEITNQHVSLSARIRAAAPICLNTVWWQV